jgi:hypothetical protein
VSATVTEPVMVDPKICTTCAPADASVPVIEELRTTSEAPARTTTWPMTCAFVRQVTPPATVTPPCRPVRVLVQAGDEPGSTVAR